MMWMLSCVPHQSGGLVLSSGLTCGPWQEYLQEDGGLSPAALRMVADLLGLQSLMFMALTEVLHVTADLRDNVR